MRKKRIGDRKLSIEERSNYLICNLKKNIISQLIIKRKVLIAVSALKIL